MNKEEIFTGEIDHPGFSVPDIDEALEFFTGVLGFEVLFIPQLPPHDENSPSQKGMFGVYDDAYTKAAAFLHYGGRKIELAQWESKERKDFRPNPADAGAPHLAITVSDIPAAYEYFQGFDNIEVRPITPMGFFYVVSPWGLEVQVMPPQGA